METKRFIISFLIVFILSTAAIAQPPDSLWSRTYGTDNSEYCSSALQDSDGGFILAGSSYEAGPLYEVAYLIKTVANGDTLWTRSYNVGRFYSVKQTADGGYVLVGYVTLDGHLDRDFYLLKTDFAGNVQWSRNYGGSAHEYATCVQQTSDGGYILGGATRSFGEGESDFWMIKTDSGGDSLWSRCFGGVWFEECNSIKQTPGGGYLLAGSTSGRFDYGDYLVVKTDAYGFPLWSRTYGGDQTESCETILLTPDGGYAFAGITSFRSGSLDFWLLITDTNGDSLWSRAYGGLENDLCTTAAMTADDGYILAGYTESWGEGGRDFWIVRTDVNGDSLWSCTFGGGANDCCTSVQQSADGGYMLAGYTSSFGAGGSDCWLIKMDSDLSSVYKSTLSEPRQFILSVYPNPFNPTTNMTFDLPRAMQAQLRIFDITGRVVTTLADGEWTAGNHTVVFDGSQLPSGIYFARLQTGSFSEARKLILLK